MGRLIMSLHGVLEARVALAGVVVGVCGAVAPWRRQGSVKILMVTATLLAASPGPARADIFARVSGDGAYFARTVVAQPAGCNGITRLLEVGEVAGPGRATEPIRLVVDDECGGPVADPIPDNTDWLEVGSAWRADHADTFLGRVDASIDGATLSVAIAGTSDSWTLALDGSGSLRAWYASRNYDGAPYLSLLVATMTADAGPRGHEQWIDLWPATDVPAAPAEVARRWLVAFGDRDAAALAALTATPFWTSGIEATEWRSWNRGCKKRRSARRAAALPGVLRCLVGANAKVAAGRLHRETRGIGSLDEITGAQLPRRLRRHRAQLTKAVRRGATLVRYRAEHGEWTVLTILVVDGNRVIAVLDATRRDDAAD